MRLPVAALAPLVASLILADCRRDPPVLLGYAYARGSRGLTGLVDFHGERRDGIQVVRPAGALAEVP